MQPQIEIEERKPIWIALSDFYLDTELQEVDFISIARKINESSFSFEQARTIDKEEIFPVLYTNLLHTTGVWSGFKEDWLVTQILKKLHKRNTFNKATNALKYVSLKWMYRDYWTKLEVQHSKLLT